ncbi:MAG: hypothetical protein ACLS2V_12655 [Clostridium paraputrificum]|uniref:hypothetical protein n=1 Tax=Clostridium sp. TaxID=1506 RepID=UPI0025BA57FB|nr:hypothetical protein [Clostridium sp.]MBS5926146.1 hypothetical protein [Clostridium sp.]
MFFKNIFNNSSKKYIKELNAKIAQLEDDKEELSGMYEQLINEVKILKEELDAKAERDNKIREEIKNIILSKSDEIKGKHKFDIEIDNVKKEYSISLGICAYGGCSMETYFLESEGEVLKADNILRILGYNTKKGMCDLCSKEYYS